MFNKFIDKKKFKEDLIAKIIMHRLSLKYLPKEYDCAEIMKKEQLFGDYIRIYLGKALYNAYVNNSKDIFWTLRYKSDFSDAIVEKSLESFISVAKSQRLLHKDV